MQYPVHVYRMAGSGTEKWIVAGRRRDELCPHGFALAAHGYPRDDTRIVRRYFAVRLCRVLIDRLHLIGHYENPIVKGAQEFTRMMESKVDRCAGAARQFVWPEREEGAIRFDEEIDSLWFRCQPTFAS